MARASAVKTDVDRWVDALGRPHRDVVNRIRRIVREAAPELEETIKWGQPCYVYRGNNVCYIAPTSDRVNFGFFRGADLEDREHLLEGTGKRLRHVKIWVGRKPRTEALRALIREAVGLYRGRSPP